MNKKINALLAGAVMTGILAGSAALASHGHKAHKPAHGKNKNNKAHKNECKGHEKAKAEKDGCESKDGCHTKE